jgi:CRISPR/Cas system-associated protein Csm6
MFRKTAPYMVHTNSMDTDETSLSYHVVSRFLRRYCQTKASQSIQLFERFYHIFTEKLGKNSKQLERQKGVFLNDRL